MKTRFQLIAKENSGFARYCPAFAKAYGCMAEGIERYREKRQIRKLCAEGECRIVANHIVESAEAAKMVVGLLSDEDGNVRNCALLGLVSAAADEKSRDATLSVLVKAISDGNERTRRTASRALVSAAADEKSRDATLSVLVKAISDGNEAVSKNAIRVLGIAAGKTDIKNAIPPLAAALSDDRGYVRVNAARALGQVAWKIDISLAVPGLVNMLLDGDGGGLESAAYALGTAFKKGGPERRRTISDALIGLKRSERSMSGEEGEGIEYTSPMDALEWLFGRMKELEGQRYEE